MPGRPSSREIRTSRRAKVLLRNMASQPPAPGGDDQDDEPRRLHDLWFRPADPFTQPGFEER